MTRRPSEHGFTLIEILVGLVLLTAFLGGIYTVVVGSMVAKRRIDETAAVYTAGPKILDIIEKDLRGAYFHGVKDMKGFKARDESVGGRDATFLDLVTTSNSKVAIEINDEFMRSDLTEVGYRLKQSEEFPDFLDLYRREQFFFDEDPLSGGQYYLVYDRVRSLKMSFFEAPEAGRTTSTIADEEGFEAWDSEEKSALPQAVKIELVLGPPPELRQDDARELREFQFVRWVLLPNAFDKAPSAENDEDTE